MRRAGTKRTGSFGGVETLEGRRLMSATPLAAGDHGGANLDWGDAPNVYGTTVVVNGPNHFIVPG